MPNGRKLAARLAQRVQEWDDLKAEGGSGNTKQVRIGFKLHAYRKPGSENK